MALAGAKPVNWKVPLCSSASSASSSCAGWAPAFSALLMMDCAFASCPALRQHRLVRHCVAAPTACTISALGSRNPSPLIQATQRALIVICQGMSLTMRPHQASSSC